MSDPTADAPAADNRVRKDDYDVGYCRPPLHARFTKGKSGNPRGRPAGHPNAKTALARVLNEKIKVREGDKTRSMTKLEAMLEAHALNAIKCNVPSANFLVGLASRTGLLAEPESDIAGALPEADRAIVQDHLRRYTSFPKNDNVDNREKR
jgi:Family of unknown function (DUF5681)